MKLGNVVSQSVWEMRKDELLSPNIPAALSRAGDDHPFLQMYRTSERIHRDILGNGNEPIMSGEFLRRWSEELGMLPVTPSITFLGGGSLPGGKDGIEFQHGIKVAAYVASLLGEITAVTGSGPGTMESTHIGAKRAVNGRATNIGVTMEPLVDIETPGNHNDILGVVKYMPRRLEALLRLGDDLINLAGGAGTLQELSVEGAAALDPRNQGSNKKIILAEPYTGDETYMRGMMRVFEEIAGKQFVSDRIILQQGSDMSPLEVVKGLKADPNGFWNNDLSLPEQAFVSVSMTPGFINSIDLSSPQDDPVRAFSSLNHLSFYLVQTILNPSYVYQNGPARIRISRSLYGPLIKVLREFWKQGRIKSRFQLDDVVRFQVV